MSEVLTREQEIFNKMAELVSRAADVPLEKVSRDSSFQQLGLDSLDALAMISDLEEEFNVKIPNQEVLKIRTVGQAIESLIRVMS